MYMFGVAVAQTVALHIEAQQDTGIVFSESDDIIKYWGSLARTLFTLFMSIAGGIDWENAAVVLFDIHAALVIYMFFILFSTFCVMNVLTGIFCQNAIETFENDKDNVMEYQLAEKTRYIDTLTRLFREWDVSGDGKCTKEEFETLLDDQRMQALMRTLDIEHRDALTVFSMMDVDGTGCLDLDEFVHGCITLRGGAKAVHMERALVDNKLANTKLDMMNDSLRDLIAKIEGWSSRKSRIGKNSPGKSYATFQGDGSTSLKFVRKTSFDGEPPEVPKAPQFSGIVPLQPGSVPEILQADDVCNAASCCLSNESTKQIQ